MLNNDLLGRGEKMEEFDEVELLEKNGKGSLKINNVKIKSLTSYNIERGTDTIDVTVKISVPTQNFRTVEN